MRPTWGLYWAIFKDASPSSDDEYEDESGDERSDDDYNDDDTGEWVSESDKEEPGRQRSYHGTDTLVGKNVWVMSEGHDEEMSTRIRPTLTINESD